MNQKGFTMVSQLAGLSIALMAFAAIAAIIVMAGRLYMKSEALSRMTSTEIALFNIVKTKDLLDQFAPELRRGVIPTNHTLFYEGSPIARPGGIIYLDARGQLCSDPNSMSCLVSVESNIQCTPAAVGFNCSLAYRISSLRQDMIPFGTPHMNAFTDPDYTVPLSFEQTQRIEMDRCDANQDLFATGMNRVSGKVNCMRKPQLVCNPGQIATGMRYNSGTGSLEVTCANTNSVECPQNYAIQSLRVTSLHPGGAKQGTCVVIANKEVPWKTNPARAQSVSGVFCPANYKTKATCSIVETSSSGNQTCNECVARVRPGTLRMQDGTRQASCWLDLNPQERCYCGAQSSWSAKVELRGTCVLDESKFPETKALL